MHLQEQAIECPYCWERITIVMDEEESGQEYTEDCQVCCRPMIINLRNHGAGLAADVRREDD